MDWSTLKTRTTTALGNRSDISSAEIIEAINTPIHEAELEHNWRFMESKTSGNFTSSSDSITIPTRYKMMKAFFITDNNKQEPLQKLDYTTLISWYPDGTNVKNTPSACALLEADSKIYVRPYPDATYAYELVVYVFSADLSDSNTSNWWLTNAWEILFYGALLHLRAFINDDEQIAKWQRFYDKRMFKLQKVFIDEEYNGPTAQVIGPTVKVY